MRATPTAPKGKKSYCTKQHFSKSVFSIVKAGCSREEHTTQGQALPTEGQHSIPLHYLLVIFSSVDFFSMPSSLSICLSNTSPYRSSFPGVRGSLVQYLPRILCSPKERLLQFSCWESCKSRNSSSEVPSSMQPNNNHKAQGFGFYDLFCLVSEDFC